MSLHLHDETKAALGDMVRRHLEHVVAAKGISEYAAELICQELSGRLASLPYRIFECVRLPAPGTKGFLVAVRVSATLDAYVTETAENWASLGHSMFLSRRTQ
jgi:hypothetical protein